MSLADELAAQLRTRRFGRPLRHCASVGSTNDEAAAWARGGAPEGATVVADAQHAGRGRLGRTWFSPDGANLYLSVVLRPSGPPTAVALVTLAAGRALFDFAAGLGLTPELKWPNDLLLQGRKVAGILTEASAMGSRVEHLVLGVGLNVSTTVFPPELQDQATSLCLAGYGATGTDRDRAVLGAGLLGHLEDAYDALRDEGPPAAVAAFRERWGGRGRRVQVRSGPEELRGVAQEIADDGALVVVTDDGTSHRVRSGEVFHESGPDHR